jgi:hypothetical protein
VFEAVKQNGLALAHVVYSRVKDLYGDVAEIGVQYISSGTNAVKHIDKQFILENVDRYEEICLMAVSMSDKSLQLIENPSWNVCFESVRYFPGTLRNIDPKLYSANQYYEVCVEAVNQDCVMIQSVMAEHLTLGQFQQLVLNAVKRDGLLMALVILTEKALVNWGIDVNTPREILGCYYNCWQNPEIAEAAVKQNGFALKYVRSDLHTDELYEIAYKSNPLASRYMKLNAYKNWRRLKELEERVAQLERLLSRGAELVIV